MQQDWTFVDAVKTPTALLNNYQQEVEKILNAVRADVSNFSTVVTEVLDCNSALDNCTVVKPKLQDSTVENSVIALYDFMKTAKAHELLGKTKRQLIFPLTPLG